MTKNIEQSILYRALNSSHDLSVLVSELQPEDFKVYPQHAEVVFAAWQENFAPTTKLIAAGFKISELMEADDYMTSMQKLCGQLKKQNTAKEVADFLTHYSKSVNSENVEEVAAEVQQKILQAVSHTAKEDADIQTTIDEFEAFRELYAQKKATGEKLLGLSTGFGKLDDIIDGLREGHLWIIGGYTNLGKTYAALNILTHLLKQGRRAVFYSLEMTRVDILARILGILTEINGNAITKGNVAPETVAGALELVKKSQLGIFKDKSDISQIVLSIHEECARNKPALIVVDFLQLVQCKDARTEYEATTKAILELQKAAQRHRVPIIVLSQVSNESARSGDQQVMGFKGSGGIAAAADLAIELVSGEESITELRKKMNEGTPVLIKWHIKKNRHGRVGTIMMEFTGKYGIFAEYDENNF
jgi:replicative DNA helicase